MGGYTTNFSKSNRNLILTVDLVLAMTSSLETDTTLPAKTKRCIERINARIKNIQDIIFGGPTLVLSPTNYRQYKRIIMSVKKLIDNIYCEVVELDFFNAVLCKVEDARVGCKNSKNTTLQREWEYLNQSLATLYGHVDPELESHQWMVLGENLAERFSGILVG